MVSFDRKERPEQDKPAKDKAPAPPRKIIGNWDSSKGDRRVRHEKRPPSEEWREPGQEGHH